MSTDDGQQSPLLALRDAVLAVRGVRRLDGGAVGTAATYLPGERVDGLRETAEGIEIHVAIDMSRPVAETADDIRHEAGRLGWRSCDVVVEDVESGFDLR